MYHTLKLLTWVHQICVVAESRIFHVLQAAASDLHDSSLVTAIAVFSQVEVSALYAPATLGANLCCLYPQNHLLSLVPGSELDHPFEDLPDEVKDRDEVDFSSSYHSQL